MLVLGKPPLYKQDQIQLERSANCQWETGKGSLILILGHHHFMKWLISQKSLCFHIVMASLIGKPGFIKLGQLLLPLGTIWKGCQLIIHKVALSYSWLPPKTPADRNGDKVNALFVLRCCANNAFSKLETRVGRKFLTDKMGVFRQLLRRPALPFLIVVSCLLVASPLWRTNQVLDKLFNLSLSRIIRLASWSWNH